MRIRDTHAEQEEPFNLVPLTDMVFNLLIFFMAATTFAQVEKDMSVQLPTTSSFVPMSAEPKQLVINIRQDGSFIVNGKTLDSKSLASVLAAASHGSAQDAVIIRADVRGYIRPFDTVTALCVAAGIDQARIVYMGDDGKPAAAP
jgi:biopolymer transport protein ExbD